MGNIFSLTSQLSIFIGEIKILRDDLVMQVMLSLACVPLLSFLSKYLFFIINVELDCELGNLRTKIKKLTS